jgi:nitrate reductase / nitrite oxidoreductase, alpha subunit
MAESTRLPPISRRRFLKLLGAAGFGAVIAPSEVFAQFHFLEPVRVANPLADYPERDWERIYRDIFRTDDSFVFLCAPNDTHNCLLRAFTKNNVVVRVQPTYGYGKATDLHGNGASPRWDPRCCQKGLVLGRRVYGDRRVNGAFLRQGFKDWVDAGLPRDPETGAVAAEYLRRGFDDWVRVRHEEAYRYHARAYLDIAQTYSGEQGERYLRAQGYDPDMIAQLEGAGVRTFKHRGGMGLLGTTRILANFRMGNSMALLDAFVRGVGPDEARGTGAWDSYSFHTDLPPGHPMVSGEQTNDFELHDTENAGLVLVWGMNWITTKMPDSHWLTEARLKGAHTVAITVEYSATASKCDDVVIIRPGTDPAFALGLAQVILDEGLYDEAFVKRFTDLPTLVRMDTLERLHARDVFPGYEEREAGAWTHYLADGERAPPTPQQRGSYIPPDLREAFIDVMVWDRTSDSPVAVSRDQVGEYFDRTGIDPALTGRYTVRLANGEEVEVRPVFELTRQYLDENMTPDQVHRLTWAPEAAIRDLARHIGANRGSTLTACGMGPNQFWNNDNKDRAIWLVMALTGNVGRHGGNLGSYAGNYKVSMLSGVPLFINEDPFDPQLDPDGEVRTRSYLRYESLHYWANGERILKAGDKVITTGRHVPTPTKAIWQSNSNSSLGNQKGHYDVVFNTLPRCELVVYNEWWWTGSCEYSDIVYGVDSWVELKQPDLTASNTNPFAQVFPATALPRAFQTVTDNEAYLGVARELSRMTGDQRFEQMWHFVAENAMEVYLQRIIDATATLRGYRFTQLHDLARRGIPALQHTRTYPRGTGYDQIHDSRPWYTRTGRLEFYRPEPEFIDAGENLLTYREPSESTFHEPCVIVSQPHPALRPKLPADWNIAPEDYGLLARQMRNTVRTVDEVLGSEHPVMAKGYRHIFHTPKYRHGAHTTPVDTDYMMALFGPFGDLYRRDPRMPGTGEMYVDINPRDALELGVDDGDYVWIDGDPEDLPFRGWQEPGREREYKVARLMARARYYPGTPRGVTRMWFNGYMASPGSVEAHETRSDGLAKNPRTNYQALFRYGGHQSLTRSWLKPTHQTHTLVHRALFGHVMAQGFAPDVHCVTGAPREAMARFTNAEPGGLGGVGRWRPAALGYRPTVENEPFRRYLEGGFVQP